MALKPEAKKNALYLTVNSVLLVAIYFLVADRFPPILPIYLAVGTVLAFWYVIYNRGFAAKGATPDMLPNHMSLAEKEAYIEEGRQRLNRSKWALTLLFPIVLTLMLDMMIQFLFPMVGGLFS